MCKFYTNKPSVLINQVWESGTFSPARVRGEAITLASCTAQKDETEQRVDH